MERKGYKTFFITNLSKPITRADLAAKFQKQWPKNTKAMIAEEKALRETNRYLHFLKKENLLSSKPVPKDPRHKKLYWLNQDNAKKASNLNILRTATIAGQNRLNGKPAPKKTSKKTTAKKTAAKRTAPKKAASNVQKGNAKAKKFF